MSALLAGETPPSPSKTLLYRGSSAKMAAILGKEVSGANNLGSDYATTSHAQAGVYSVISKCWSVWLIPSVLHPSRRTRPSARKRARKLKATLTHETG